MGVTELFSGILVVYRIALGSRWGPLGPLRGSFGSIGVPFGRRPHRTAQARLRRDLPLEVSELGKGWFKKEGIHCRGFARLCSSDVRAGFALQCQHIDTDARIGCGGNRQTTNSNEDVLGAFGFISVFNTPWDSLDCDLLSGIHNRQSDSCDFAMFEVIDPLEPPWDYSNDDLQAFEFSTF